MPQTIYLYGFRQFIECLYMSHQLIRACYTPLGRYTILVQETSSQQLLAQYQQNIQVEQRSDPNIPNSKSP